LQCLAQIRFAERVAHPPTSPPVRATERLTNSAIWVRPHRTEGRQ
jgi:hypothetical protein